MIAAAAASVQWLLDAGDTQDRLITSNDDRVEIARAKTRFFFMYIRSNRHDDGPDADWASALFNSRSHDMPIEFPLFTESFFVLKCIHCQTFFFSNCPYYIWLFSIFDICMWVAVGNSMRWSLWSKSYWNWSWHTKDIFSHLWFWQWWRRDQ